MLGASRRAKIRIGSLLAIACAAGGCVGGEPRPLAQPSRAVSGADVYRNHCAVCHGPEGRGDGEAADRFAVRPRNFVIADYRFRSTGSGKLPTDADLERSIATGLGGTGMVPQNHLSAAEIAAVIEYIKRLSPRFAAEKPAKVVKLPPPRKKTDIDLKRGRSVYLEAGCHGCHGDEGDGNGRNAADLSMPPTNLTRHPLKGGSTAADILRAVITGLNGTPMPSYHLLYDDDDFWALAYYVESLGTDRGLSEQARIGWEVERRAPPG